MYSVSSGGISSILVMEGRGTVSSHCPSLSHGWSTTVSREERCCASTTSMVLSRLRGGRGEMGRGRRERRDKRGEREGEGGESEGRRAREGE